MAGPELLPLPLSNPPLGGSSEAQIPGRQVPRTPYIPGMGQIPETTDDDFVPGASDGDEYLE